MPSFFLPQLKPRFLLSASFILPLSTFSFLFNHSFPSTASFF